jgi:hypothetical protein
MKNLLLGIIFLPLLISSRYGSVTHFSGYKASNGKTYNVGDTIKLGRGSDANGDFKYIILGGLQRFLSRPGDQRATIDKTISGYGAIIKKMNSKSVGGFEKMIFSIKVQGYPSNLDLYIEDAIATCEVADCIKTGIQQSGDKFDQLKKLKDLLDAGAINQAEYDAQKKKLLDN